MTENEEATRSRRVQEFFDALSAPCECSCCVSGITCSCFTKSDMKCYCDSCLSTAFKVIGDAGSNCNSCHVCLSDDLYHFMILCPDCGSKRCPKASWHDNECTGSNEPGQPGSVYS